MPNIEIITDCSKRDVLLLHRMKDSEIECICRGARCGGNSQCMACETRLCGYEFKKIVSDLPEINSRWGEELLYHLSTIDPNYNSDEDPDEDSDEHPDAL